MHNGSRDFDLILEKAGIPKVDELSRKLTAHSFRHTYATMMAEKTGHNPFLLKEALGHQQLSTTERYCHPTAPVLMPALDGIASLGFSQRGARLPNPMNAMWRKSLVLNGGRYRN